MRYYSNARGIIVVLALYLACVGTAAAQREETDHVRLSTPIIKAWRDMPVGSPICALDEVVKTKDWLDRSLIQRIDFQTGIWHIFIEPGYSVFRVYPYLSTKSPQPTVYQGIVLKVIGDVSRDDLITAIRKHNSAIKIDEYDIFGADRFAVQRYSRHRDPYKPTR